MGLWPEGRLVEKIRKGSNFVPGLSLVAETEGRIVGHILFSKIQIMGSSIFETLALAPMAVIPKLQRKGIGSGLINRGIEEAKELGFDSVIVLGHKEYYPKLGFRKAPHWGIKCLFDVPEEALTAIELKDGALRDKAGIIEYPEEFLG